MNGILQAIEKSFDEKKGAIWCEKKMCVMVSVTMCAANYKGEIDLLLKMCWWWLFDHKYGMYGYEIKIRQNITLAKTKRNENIAWPLVAIENVL